MKFAQNIHPTRLFGPTRLIGTWEYRNRYNIIDHGHKKNDFYVFFQRPIKSVEGLENPI